MADLEGSIGGGLMSVAYSTIMKGVGSVKRWRFGGGALLSWNVI